MSISLLRRLLMKEAVKDTAGSSGIMSINKKIADKVEQQLQRYVNDAMQQGVDLDTLSPEQLKMIVQMNKPQPPRVIAADSPEGRGITEALLGKRGEVVDMAGKKLDTSQGIMGGKSVKELMDSGQVSKGARGMKKSKKVQDREMFQAANERLTSDVDTIVKNIKRLSPMDAMKEANLVIGRKGYYKNLSPEESKKILKDTEDHIFERDIPEEDFAKGGRAGFAGGSDMGTVADSKGKTGPSKGGYQGGGTGPVERPTGGGSGNDNNTTYDYTIPKQIVKQTAVNTAKNLARNKVMNTLGLAKFSNPIGIAMALKSLYDQTQNPTLTEEEAMGGGITGIDPSMLRDSPYENMASQSMATGGRAGFMAGGMGRRGFLKLLAGTGAGIAGLKSGLVNIMGKGTGKEVAKEVVKQSTNTPPPYFFKLAEKIKMLGDDATATTDRTISKSLKSKDGKSEYLLEEDITSGDTIIKKINKEGDEMITDVEIMDFKKGEVVMGKNGKPVKTPDNYEEVTEANARIEGDVFNDPYYSDGIQVDEIMKEVGEQAPSIKKADGGIMRAGYQMGGDVAYDATNQDIYGSSAITVTPDTVMDQFGNQVQAEMGNNYNKPLIPQVTEEAATRRLFSPRIPGTSPIANASKPPLETPVSMQTPFGQPLFDKDGFRLGDQRYGTGLVGGPSMALPGSGLTNQTPLAGSGGISEIDMPIAGGNNNAGGILPVESQLPGFRDEKAEYYTGKDYGPGNQPYAAVMPQEGMRFVYDQNGRRYSVPIEGYEGPIGNPIKSLEKSLATKLASGGIARMLGE